MDVNTGSISQFIDRHYRHFNAAVLKDAADAYIAHLDRGGKMMITLAGAMSTAELGISLAEMIRQDKVHAITCTGANLEEDLFNLVARTHYERLPNYRELSPKQEEALFKRHLNRVTDTCIPEEEAIRRIERLLIDEWVLAVKTKERKFPHEFLFKVLRECRLKKFYEIDPADSWMMAAAQKDLPMVVPGWEDSTLGNIYAARCITGHISDVHTVRSGIEYMMALVEWYRRNRRLHPSAFFRSAAASRAISRSALCRCSIRTSSPIKCRSGVISARSAIQPPASGRIRARSRMKKSPGANSAPAHPVLLLSLTPQLWRP